MAQPRRYTVSRSRRIDASPERIYGIIRDYREGHPSILPRAFRHLRVEAGGIGAGTKLRFDATVFGRTQQYVGVVAEPEPGRVLTETYSEPTESVTTFVVEPRNDGHSATVTFITEIPGRGGIVGRFERWLANRVLQRIYAEELQNLADRAAQA